MESEKVKEIKKALEDNKTDHLPYIDGYKCKFVDYSDILTLINELESENETLRNAKVVYETVDYCYEDLKKAEKRIAELEKENAIKNDTIVDLLKKQEFYEKEKLTKFAERVKEKLFDLGNIVNENDIDETLKEFLG